MREFPMNIVRRSLGIVAVAAVLAIGGLLPARADSTVPYSDQAFKGAQASGQSILVEIHAGWCPTCKAQKPIIDKLTSDSKFKDLKIFRVDFDDMKPAVQAFGAKMQSTLIVFKGANEIGRSVGDTKEASIAALLDKSL
jgi:thioredoxin 1